MFGGPLLPRAHRLHYTAAGNSVAREGVSCLQTLWSPTSSGGEARGARTFSPPPSSGPEPGPAQLGGGGRGGGAGTTDSGISDPDASRAGGAPGAWAQRAHTVGSGQCPSPTCSSEASYFRAWNSVSGASLPSLTRQAPLGSGGRGPASMRSLHLAGASSAGTPPRGKFPAGVGGLLLADH